MSNRRFNYESLEMLQNECRARKLDIRFSADVSPLASTLRIAGKKVPNRLAIQPMEGFDGLPSGSPGQLTFRRYRRFAAGGAGLIWFEATAIAEDARSNPHQLLITGDNEPDFAHLLEKTKETYQQEYGSHHEPLCILQLTHSGRFSRPAGDPRPVVAMRQPEFDDLVDLPPGPPPITDRALEAMVERFVECAWLAYRAGFDGVDIKACHRYLISELLAARTRRGPYGGDYRGRTRFLKQVVSSIGREVPDLILACRMNAYDGVIHTYGWGVERRRLLPDLEEPVRLARELKGLGVSLFNITAGTPYYNPHVNRPYDRRVDGGYSEPEHPLEGVGRLFTLGARIQCSIAPTPVVGTGYSWLRHYGGLAAAGNVARNQHQLAGFGRQAFAYPDFARDLLSGVGMKARRSCITCSKCSQLTKMGQNTGCVVRDPGPYAVSLAEAR